MIGDTFSLVSSLFIGVISIVVYNIISFYIKVSKYPPGPTPLPFIGNVLILRQKNHVHDILHSEAKKYGPIMTLWLGQKPQIFVTDPHLVLQVLKSKAFAGRLQFEFTQEFISKPGSEVMSFGDIGHGWEVLRRTTYSAIRKYASSPGLKHHVTKAVDMVMDDILKNKQKSFDIGMELKTITVSLLAKSIFSKDVSLNSPALKDLMTITDVVDKEGTVLLLVGFSPIFKLFYHKTWSKVLEMGNFFKKIAATNYDEHLDNFDESETRDFIDAFISTRFDAEKEGDTEAVKYLDKWNILNALNDLFFAGSDTTRTSLHWFFLLICTYPEMQQRIRDEVDEILPHQDDVPSLEMRNDCPFLIAFILEVLRFRPLLPTVLPHKTMEDTSLGGFSIPSGTTILPSTFACMRDETNWPKSNDFNPDRFLDGNKVIHRPNQCFLPFSTGRRACIGEKLALANMFLIVTRMFQKTKGMQFQLVLKPGETPQDLLKGDIYRTDFFAPTFYRVKLASL